MVVAVTHKETHKPTLLQAVACERQGVYSVDSRRKRWDRKDRNDIDVNVCVCSFIIMFVCAWFYCFFFSACLFIHLPFCLHICQSHCVLCASVLNLDSICRVFSVQGLFSSPLAWKVFLCLNLSASSVKPNYPKYWNQLNMHQGLMQIIVMTLCSTRHCIVSLNPITTLGLPVQFHSFIHLFIHSSGQRPAPLKSLLVFH